MRTVFTNGCFDILHAGHVDMLRKARSLGQWLVVGLNTDRSIRALKGDGRPVNQYCHRESVLRELRCVDQIVPLLDTDVRALLRELRPSVWVKGGDYTIETLNKGEVEIARGLGIEIEIIPVTVRVSTTQILAHEHQSAGRARPTVGA